MSKLKIKAGGMSFEATGEDEFISRERETFFTFVGQCRDMPVKEGKDSGSCTHTKKSWVEIAEDIKAGKALYIGDTVRCALTDGTEADFVVTDNTDEYVRFESRECIGGYVRWNNGYTNEGGYPESNVRKYVDEKIWNLLPEDLRSVISDTERKWKDKDGNEATYTTKLFLPAESEISKFDEYSLCGDGGLYEPLEWYKSRRSRDRYDEDDDTCDWWLASVSHGSSMHICFCNADGCGEAAASDECNVSVCFQISKS